MKVYLSGPMTGYPDLNRPAFHRVAAYYREKGHTVMSPAELPVGLPREQAMRVDLLMLLSCQGIVLLDRWERSKGATLECMVAVDCGLRIFSEAGEARYVELQAGSTGDLALVWWRDLREGVHDL